MRQMTLPLKCNANITRPQSPIAVTEYNPADPNKQPTICKYFFAPIESSMFCPQGDLPPQGAYPKSGAENNVKICAINKGKSLGDVEVVTTGPMPYLQAGFACSKLNNCTHGIYGCKGSLSNSSCVAANVVSMESSSGFKYSSVGFGSSSNTCTDSTKATGFVSTSDDTRYWGMKDSTWYGMMAGEGDPMDLAVVSIQYNTTMCFNATC